MKESGQWMQRFVSCVKKPAIDVKTRPHFGRCDLSPPDTDNGLTSRSQKLDDGKRTKSSKKARTSASSFARLHTWMTRLPRWSTGYTSRRSFWPCVVAFSSLHLSRAQRGSAATHPRGEGSTYEKPTFQIPNGCVC